MRRPEPLGEGTQASFQPSLKSVEHGNGRQVVRIGMAEDRLGDRAKDPLYDAGCRRSRARRGRNRAGSSSRRSDPASITPIRRRSARFWAGNPDAGTGGDGSCAGARPANVNNERASAAANGPPRRRRISLPAIGRPLSVRITSVPALGGGTPACGLSPGTDRRAVGATR